MADIISGGASVLNVSIKIAQTVYELKAVNEQAKDLLRTVENVLSALHICKEMRHAKSDALEAVVKAWIDAAISNTEIAADSLADLVEDVRVEMQVNERRIFQQTGHKKSDEMRLLTRAKFLLVDSPKIMERMQRLNMTQQGLYAALGTMSNRHKNDISTSSAALRRQYTSRLPLQPRERMPPTYWESEFWSRKFSIRKSPNRSDQAKVELVQEIAELPSLPPLIPTSVNQYTSDLSTPHTMEPPPAAPERECSCPDDHKDRSWDAIIARTAVIPVTHQNMWYERRFSFDKDSGTIHSTQRVQRDPWFQEEQRPRTSSLLSLLPRKPGASRGTGLQPPSGHSVPHAR